MKFLAEFLERSLYWDRRAGSTIQGLFKNMPMKKVVCGFDVSYRVQDYESLLLNLKDTSIYKRLMLF